MRNFCFYPKLLILLWCFCWGFESSTLANSKKKSALFSKLPGLEQRFQRFIGHNELTHAQISFTVLDANTGRQVFAYNAHQGMAPASTLKTLTAAAAFQVLGVDFRYKTTLLISGSIDAEGTLHGNLIIRGSGDPTLGSQRFESTKASLILGQWVAAVQKAGIRRINGHLIADDLATGGYRIPGGWPWQDIGNYYGAGFNALNWKENQFDVRLRPGNRPGSPVRLEKVDLDQPPFQVHCEVSTGPTGSGDQVYGFSAPYGRLVFLRGSYGMDLSKAISLAHPNPSLQVLSDLERTMASASIRVEGKLLSTYQARLGNENWSSSAPGSQGKLLHEHFSPTLKEIVYWFNQKSINLYGEAILWAIQAQASAVGEVNAGVPPTINTDQWGSWLSSYWVNQGLAEKGELRLYDASGLSPENRVTTQAMTQILLVSKNQAWYPHFYSSLPTYNGMKMKSGTISGVLGYAGYHKSRAGEEYVFSILVANYTGTVGNMRTKLFELLNALK